MTGKDEQISISGAPTLEASIGVQVKKLRAGLDMTIGDLAKVSGLSPGLSQAWIY